MQGGKGFMKKSKLPFPVVVLISATLFLFSSSVGEWLARPSVLAAPPRESAKQQEAAIVYVRAMSWVARLISHPSAHAPLDTQSAQADDPSLVSTREVLGRRVQICAMRKPARPPKGLRRSWQLTIQSSPHSLARLVAVQRITDN